MSKLAFEFFPHEKIKDRLDEFFSQKEELRKGMKKKSRNKVVPASEP
jgi:hypothetical protein